eukprot:TRINITY_DN340_c0_g1_i1.p1 TRINITY_DN340_c0_g1~~TRINITY_DN340_c0_g1_i1.p1  ORF type:complete len:208 (-),score=38.45 TRINITY_DN340_c0_g1_i1:105-728(-)
MLPKVFKSRECGQEYFMTKYLAPYLLGIAPENIKSLLDVFSDKETFMAKRPTLSNEGGSFAENMNVPDVYMTEMPSVNGLCNAKSLGIILNMLANYGEVNGVRILKKETVEDMLKLTTSSMMDAWLGRGNTTFTDGGYGCNLFNNLSGDTAKWYGWVGYGGSISQFCPERKLSFTYTMNGIAFSLLGDHRTTPYWKIIKDKFPLQEQ